MQTLLYIIVLDWRLYGLKRDGHLTLIALAWLRDYSIRQDGYLIILGPLQYQMVGTHPHTNNISGLSTFNVRNVNHA